MHNQNKYNDEHRYNVHSDLDDLTMEDAMINDYAMIAVLCITILYSGIAYFFVYTFCKEMKSFEFREIEFQDSYVSGNSVMIKGINKDLSV
jgi:hypothetical protein